jgi:hypothetical protein
MIEKAEGERSGRGGWILMGSNNPINIQPNPTQLNSTNISPSIHHDYPLDLSILVSGGKETNKDSYSNGE